MHDTALRSRALTIGGDPAVVDDGPFVVVGAGIAGLCAAWSLARSGASVQVLERSDRAGGQLESVELAGVNVDLGAESFATRGGWVEGLLHELGRADQIELPARSSAWLVGAGRAAAPLPPTALFGIPGDPFESDVVALLGADAAERAAADRTMPPVDADAVDDLGSLVADRMGEAVLTRLVDPVVRGVFSCSARELAIDVAHPGLRAALRATGSLSGAVASLRASAPAGSAVAGIRGGMWNLVDWLSADLARLGVDIVTGAEVHGLDPDGVEVRIDGRSSRIAATPIVAAPALASPARRTREITVVALAVDAPALEDAPRGTGALVVPGAPGIVARALTHSSAKWSSLAAALPPGRHVLRLSYDRLPHTISPSELRRLAIADAAAILGCDPGVVVDIRMRPWLRTIESAPSPRIPVVGEAASTTGIASIVAAPGLHSWITSTTSPEGTP